MSSTDTHESADNAARRFAGQVLAVEALHTKRTFDGDGYGWSICVEDRQHWPCATIQALRAANERALNTVREP